MPESGRCGLSVDRGYGIQWTVIITDPEVLEESAVCGGLWVVHYYEEGFATRGYWRGRAGASADITGTMTAIATPDRDTIATHGSLARRQRQTPQVVQESS